LFEKYALMPQIKHYIQLLFYIFWLTSYAQNSSTISDQDQELKLKQLLDNTQILTDRGDYYNAKDNLNKALNLAENINDKTSEGIIYTKLGKLQYLINEPLSKEKMETILILDLLIILEV